jgi:hypothetical protein
MGAPLMAGSVIRDPVGDHLLTPQNAAKGTERLLNE